MLFKEVVQVRPGIARSPRIEAITESRGVDEKLREFAAQGESVNLTGGDSALFDGARGYMYYLQDDGTYLFDMPIEFKKSADGIVGFSISSVDPKTLGDYVD